MTDIAGCTLRPAKDLSAGYDPAADAGSRLDEDHVVDMPIVLAMLVDRHQVDVVLDIGRRLEALTHPTGNVELIPAIEHRRSHNAAALEIHRGGQTEAKGEQEGMARPCLG